MSTTPAAQDAAAPAAPAAGANEWITAGLWQTRLAGLWFVYCRPALAAREAQAGDGEQPAVGPERALWNEVLEPFLRPNWWPAIRVPVKDEDNKVKVRVEPWPRFIARVFTADEHPIDYT